MLEYYGNTSKFMTENYSKWNERDPKAIQDAIGGYLTGAGNMLNSATLTRSNITSEQASVCIILSILSKLHEKYCYIININLDLVYNECGSTKVRFQRTTPLHLHETSSKKVHLGFPFTRDLVSCETCCVIYNFVGVVYVK